MNFAKVCNLWCGHCFYPEVSRRAEQAVGPKDTRFLPRDTMIAVADEMAKWTERSVLRIAADGEPLINPHAVDMVKYAKARGLTVSLTTNGILLTEPVARRLLAAGIDAIDVSVDAASPETYAKVRPSRGGVNFYSVVERNVVELIRQRDATDGPGRTRVIVNMIDQPATHGEVPAFIERWKGYGADVVLIRPFHSTAGQTLQAGVSVAVRGVRRFPCRFPFTRLNIGFDRGGHPVVYYCSHDWLEKTIVGTLGRDGGLRDIWHGSKMREIRRRHVENDYPADSLCGPCPDWYLGWGRSIHGLVAELKGAAGA
jgi:molybdenum cofactor biosynthesis enzyme MoaA